MNSTYIGVDLGGSTLKAVCTDADGAVLRRSIAPAGGRIARQQLFDAVKTSIAVVSGSGKADRIGLCFGGAIQPNGTMFPKSTNLPNIANLPLVHAFESQLGCKIRIDNDARAAMRGEAWSGAAREARNAITITFGTGIGSGIMIDRKIVPGAHGRAGEVGVWKLNDPPEAGEWLSFEDTSAPGRVEAKTGKRFAAMFASGAAQDMIRWTGRAIANVHLLLDLDVAVLLGGIMEQGEPLREAIETAFRQACQDDYHSGFEIKLGSLGALAGAVGAASLWRFDQQ